MTETIAVNDFIYNSSFTIEVDSEGVGYRQNEMPAFMFIHRTIRTLFREPDLDELGLSLNKVINKVYEFLGNDNIDLNSEARGADSFVEIINYDKKYEKAAENKRSGYLTSFPSNRWDRADKHYFYCRFSYAKKIPRITLYDNFADILSMLLEKKVPSKDIPLASFITLLDEAALAIDNLFVQQNIEPSSQKRGNLISLLLDINDYLLIHPDISRILKTNGDEEHDIFNTNIIRLAGNGCDSSVLKLLYAYDYYPEVEILESLISVPYSMIPGVLGLK